MFQRSSSPVDDLNVMWHRLWSATRGTRHNNALFPPITTAEAYVVDRWSFDV